MKFPHSVDHIEASKRCWDAIDLLIKEGRLESLETLSRVWNYPLNKLIQLHEKRELLAGDYINNLILRYSVNPVFIWLGHSPILLKILK